MEISLLMIITVVVYLIATAIFGYIGYKQTTTSSDYLVAGRKQHPMIMALSYGATFISTSAIVGFGGAAASMGMGMLWLTFLNIFVGIFIAFVYFGKRTRKMGHSLDAHTFPELMGRRYESRFIQGASGLLIFTFMPLYAGAVMIGGAVFLQQVFGINYEVALLFFAAITAVYVVFGGMKGVMYTDAFQGAIMFIGMAILLVFTYVKLGGVITAHEKLTALASLVPAGMAKGGHTGWTSMPKFASPMWMSLVTTLVMGVGLGVLAQPQLSVRFMTVKSNKELNRAVMIGGIFILMMTGVAFTVGALTNVYFVEKYKMISLDVTTADPAVLKAMDEGTYAAPKEEPKVVASVKAIPAATKQATGEVAASVKPAKKAIPDNIIPLYIAKAMPEWFTALFMVTLLAAAMSTLSSQFHTMGTALSRDFYEKGLEIKSKNSLLLNKVGTGIGIVFAVVVAWLLPKALEGGSNIIAIGTSLFFGLCAAAFIPMYIGALYSKSVTKTAAIASFAIGSLTSLFWMTFFHTKESSALKICKFIFGKDTLATNPVMATLDPIVVALPISFLVILVVSMMTKKTEEKHLKKCFDGIKGGK
jgi:SSS family solute:Na+ symporter